MDSQAPCLASAAPAVEGDAKKEKESCLDPVDPFLKEALQNPRHRLTVLRMELDIQKFMQNTEQQQFEFPHFPTSYLRLAAHRVAQHYNLQSIVLDNNIDGTGGRIAVLKTAESRYPTVCLGDIPAKQAENEKLEQVKIAIKPRPRRANSTDSTELGLNRSTVRTVEERKEDYEKARARIFSGFSNGESEEISLADARRGPCSSGDESESYRNLTDEVEKHYNRDSSSGARIAIFRDREKDRSDPDYDRSYVRYVKVPSNQNIAVGGHFPLLQPQFVSYDGFSPLLLPRTQSPLNYQPSNPNTSPFCAVGSSQSSSDSVYMHWPTPAMMYAHSYEHLRQAVVQAPFYSQPLSFDYLQNH
ncbi:hypothetical protein H6P81_007739 [Aristolochia fimbriata]|uniref:Uncharacterized protein n=1 Tax=Aristolochia fimbriata TaxID=158543 RepID=A0AAV7F139_ARIFI|nr:hypothetical protein H6P81_007739 [Aristolochia fimbriata]